MGGGQGYPWAGRGTRGGQAAHSDQADHDFYKNNRRLNARRNLLRFRCSFLNFLLFFRRIFSVYEFEYDNIREHRLTSDARMR